MDLQKFWNTNSKYWSDNINKGSDHTRDLFGLPSFLEFLGNITGKRILDAGCGDGNFSRKLATNGAIVTGFDFSQNMIDIAKSYELENKQGIKYFTCSIDKVEKYCNSEYFDIIVSYMVLCCCKEIDQFFKQSWNILRKDGYLIIGIPHPCFNNYPYSWIKDKNNNINGLLISNYFDETKYVRSWDFASMIKQDSQNKMTEARYPWTLSTYLNLLSSNGFKLQEIREPRPTKESVRLLPRLKRWYKHAACFLFIKVQKYD